MSRLRHRRHGGKLAAESGTPERKSGGAIPHTTHLRGEGDAARERHDRKSRARGGPLTSRERKALKPATFVFPKERKYPIPNKSHGRNALARVSASGTPEEKSKVRAAVHRKFPSIGKNK